MKQMYSKWEGSVFYLYWRQNILELWPIKLDHQPLDLLSEEGLKKLGNLRMPQGSLVAEQCASLETAV